MFGLSGIGKYLGCINMTSGAPSSAAASTCTKADGTTGALTIPPLAALWLQPASSAVSINTDGVTATLTPGPGFGVKIGTDMLFPHTAASPAIGAIPSDGASSAKLHIFLRLDY